MVWSVWLKPSLAAFRRLEGCSRFLMSPMSTRAASAAIVASVAPSMGHCVQSPVDQVPLIDCHEAIERIADECTARPVQLSNLPREAVSGSFVVVVPFASDVGHLVDDRDCT